MPEGVEFEATEISSTMEQVTASLQKLPSAPNSQQQLFVVTFQVKPGVPRGPYRGKDAAKVTLKTNHPLAPEIEFRVAFSSI
jgi:hypothetical protein